ncbi:phosphate ABC transporter permease PstA [Leptolyngbya sp. FACHB-261]|uniref:phosphate ABC transporter permease PstA n=1 Tax=Leptolyngbya sp. FACHB-261 TaxID=2692806 RepID=UPI0016898D4B|nr:phosphate ABC transporter permease PstA [Leptolyngbya sp. FACHB-261]MBD2099391.1 phosphate ABC transporter permease PstA [Leptolyngbya sp. FACHB-261]
MQSPNLIDDSKSGSEILTQPLPLGRVLFNRIMTVLAFLFLALALLPLLAVLFEVLRRGLPNLSLEAFTALPAPPGITDQPNGFGNAIQGTLLMVGIASLLSVPVGIMAAVYISEFGRGTWLAAWIRFATNILSGVPSIVMGVFAYAVIVYTSKTFSAFAGSVALAVLMLPIVVRATEEALKLVPDSLRQAAVALGATQFQTTTQVVVATALPGIVTGVLLAVARAAGETAPLLFTALFTDQWTDGLFSPTASLSVLIFNFYNDPDPNRTELLWTASLLLVGLVLFTSVLSRVAARNPMAASRR